MNGNVSGSEFPEGSEVMKVMFDENREVQEIFGNRLFLR